MNTSTLVLIASMGAAPLLMQPTPPANQAVPSGQPPTQPPTQPTNPAVNPPATQPAVQPVTPPAASPTTPPTAQPVTPPPPAVTDPLARFQQRLDRLRPSDPNAYFLLGEEVADAVDGPDRLRLARELFVLAFTLDVDRTGGRGGELAASCCLAIASLSRNEGERRWLTALAATIDPRRKPPGWIAEQQQAVSAQTAFFAASALGAVRAGDGRQALLYLDDPQVRALLGRYDRLIVDSPYKGTLAATELEASRWPCRECANARIVRRSSRAGDYKLCPTCSGRPGMPLTASQWLAQIRLESLLLSGIHKSWGAQVASDLGEPLRDPDVRDLPGVLGISIPGPVWRNNAWRAETDLPSRP